MILKKNTKFGNKLFFLIIFFLLGYNSLFGEDKIKSTPSINLDKIKPSFDISKDENVNSITNQNIKEKIKSNNSSKSSHVVLIGLDKITAKSSKLKVNLNEVKLFGPLEIKILKCGKVKVNNTIEEVAYMQVKDLTKNENDKVYIFNGWTFASDPSLSPFDHAIYDLQLLSCFNI